MTHPADLTIGGDDYLAIVERQRAEALAAIERVKNVVRAECLPLSASRDPGAQTAQERAYQQGRRDMTAVFRAAIEVSPAAHATVRGQADAEMEEG